MGVEINYYDDERFFTHKRLDIPRSWVSEFGRRNNGIGKISNNWSSSRKITRNGSLNLKVNLKNIDVFNDPDGDLVKIFKRN